MWNCSLRPKVATYQTANIDGGSDCQSKGARIGPPSRDRKLSRECPEEIDNLRALCMMRVKGKIRVGVMNRPGLSHNQ
jgi:hypothetical protein